MGRKRNRSLPRARAEPQKRSVVFASAAGWEEISSLGYTSLDRNPEIVAAVDTIARLIGSMTIQLMENAQDGDIRIRDELAKKVDVDPNRYMTRSNFIHWIVKNLFLDGHGNVVVWPQVQRGILQDLVPIPPALVSLIPDGLGYKILAAGKEYAPDELLHFVLNPGSYYPWKGEGFQVSLAEVANNLKQAAATEKGFMSSKWKPSIIVKVDALVDEFSSPEGRQQLVNSYLDTQEPGTPWLIPADNFQVEQVKPLTLADLALADMVTLDKKTVASIIGVPAFVLGVGEFKRDEWNNFVRSRIMPIARMIEQELTKKLLYSPNRFFRFNARSLYNYDLKEMAQVADDQYIRGIMTGNEVRDWIGLSPIKGLNELVILENYIPAGMIGQQNKLNGGE